MLRPDASQWQLIYDRLNHEMAAFVHARVDEDVAEDLLQDAWTALALTLETTFVGDPRAWLYRVVRNRITDHYRTRAGRPAVVDLTSATEIAEAALPEWDPTSLQQAIEQAVDRLPSGQREVWLRNEMGGETLREIAADLGIPLKTAISRKGYARAKLQAWLSDVYTDYFGEE